MADVRPPTTADVLREAADEMVRSAHALEFVAMAFRMPPPEMGHELESDLRMLATWFDLHPDADGAAYAVMSMENHR